MSKAEKTKAFIIEKSASIFNMKGYAGTSLTDLIEATGLSKGSIYGNFANKEEIAIAVFKYNIARINQLKSSFMDEKETAFDKMIAFTEFYRTNWKKMFEKGGCAILNASIEADDNLPFLKKHVQSSIKNWVAGISDIVEKGKQNGEFKKNVDAPAYAYLFLTLIEGGIMVAKISNNQHLLFAALDRIVMILNTEIKK